MATNGMTIDGLNNLSSLTANDEVPVWDKEASAEPTQKITAQNLANSVKSLASLPNTTEMNAAIQQSTADINNNGLSMRTNLAKGTAPSATQYYTVSRMFQAGSGTANTDRVGELLEASIDSSGTTKTRLGAYQFASGSSAYNAIDVLIDKNGNKSYAVTDPAAFREAIGANVIEYVNIGAENMLTRIAQMTTGTMLFFRTTGTTTGQPGTGMYLIGTAIRANNNISIRATEMEKPEVMYQNNTTDAGSTWKGWKKFTGTAV